MFLSLSSCPFSFSFLTPTPIFILYLVLLIFVYEWQIKIISTTREFGSGKYTLAGKVKKWGGGEQRKVFMKAKKHCILLAYGEKCQVICVRWAPKPYLKCQPASQPTQIRVISPLQMLGPYCPPVRKHKGKEEKAFAFQVSLSKAFSLANIRVAAQCLHDNLQDCSRQKSDIGVPLPLLV